MLRYLPLLLIVALTVYCLIDCLQSDGRATRILAKLPWVLVILLLPVVGPVAWLLVGRPPRARSAQSPTRQPRGPDDDPEFLRDI